MERHLDEELKKLNTDLLTMAAKVEGAIHQSIEALKKRDAELAEQVIVDDKVIDEMEISIEEQIIELLALFQPMAGDLRFITTGMHINSELERIADLTVNISQRILDIAGQEHLKPLVDIPKLGDQAKMMVKSAIDAFVKKDEAMAKNVILSDKESNNLRTSVIKELINDYMVKDGSTVPRAVPLLLITRDLERICDHAASIAEDVIYMIQAKVVKHHRERLTAIDVEDGGVS
jgi:phosphate transport system protein